jgi:RimJ/RimL family protein N-acetyltransferase
MPAAPLPERTSGPRLTLRRWTADDVDRLAAAVAASVEHLRPWMPWAAEEPLERATRLAKIREWEHDWSAGGDLVLAMELGDDVVGGCGLHHRVGPGALEIGYWVHADHARRGFATEAAGALTTLAFTVPGIERVEIHHDRSNVASAGVPRRLGFTLVAEEPDEPTAPAECGVECRWAVRRADWPARAGGS